MHAYTNENAKYVSTKSALIHFGAEIARPMDLRLTREAEASWLMTSLVSRSACLVVESAFVGIFLFFVLSVDKGCRLVVFSAGFIYRAYFLL